jgi:hypothetical protein
MLKSLILGRPLGRLLLAAAVASAVVISTNDAHALLASDNSSNYSETFIGLNNGSGFSAWSGSGTGSGGNYIGGSGLSSSSFAIYSGGGAGNSYQATRPFSTAMNVGDTFSIQIGYTGVANPGGEIGINLFSGGSFRLGFKFIGGAANWQLNDGGSNFGTGLTWQGGDPGSTINFAFTRNDGNGYGLNITQSAESYIDSVMTSSSGIMSIDSFQVYSSAQGGGENVGFNNLSVVPEPSTYALLGLGTAFGLWQLRRRKRE